ncbi:MAG: phosphoenolpyruvate-protein phosphotransferase [Acidobacteria bacterium OLB17]|nr:MAG: phosphoenolpyruvate-protein phosphotransferase [Acidobacteria bacterium OLB17]MCZ2392138.1 phosphoenolpyruvate--protein phosphotransferase [Acidobacteriota bacterium]
MVSPLKDGLRASYAGRSVSHGRAVGRALLVVGRKRQFFHAEIAKQSVDAEIERFRAAVTYASLQLEALIAKPPTPNAADIFDAHLLILESSSLLDAVAEVIRTDLVTAEWALKTVTDKLVSSQRASADVHLRQKAVDIEDVAERVSNALAGERSALPPLPPNTVIVATELLPSTMMEFSGTPPVAIITERGGWTSHTFILARESNIPAVSGIKRVNRRFDDGDLVIVDGDNGFVTFASEEEFERSIKDRASRGTASTAGAEADDSAVPAFRLYVNIDSSTKITKGLERGALGIGLLRSEYLFPGIKGWPDEERQFREYAAAAEAADGREVRIRTFDFDLDQVSFGGREPEKNPALGMRAIRLGLAREQRFRTQLRAILRANTKGNISIILPMVAGVQDIKQVRSLIDDEFSRLDGIQFPKIGAMIELPSAVLVIDQILKNVDFLAIGTNDLVQYTLGVDRDDEMVADWYQSLHPAILRSISRVIDAAKAVGKPTSLCGEMGGSAFYVPLLVGLGAEEFSVKLSSLSTIRRILRSLDREKAAEIARVVMELDTTQAVEDALVAAYRTFWPELQLTRT